MNDPPKDHKVPLWALDNLYLYPLYCGTYFLKTSFDAYSKKKEILNRGYNRK